MLRRMIPNSATAPSYRRQLGPPRIDGLWTPRDLRHTFVSIMSERGASVELIADLVGHKDLATTRTVYRRQLRPVITEGAELMDAALRESGPGPKGTILPPKRGSLFRSPLAGDKSRRPFRT
jgi:hypothetical protein